MILSTYPRMIMILRCALAVLAGLVLGSVVNMGLIMLGGLILPPPPGVDMSDAESISAGMASFGPEHFAIPFLAHALGTLAGALVAYLIARLYRTTAAAIVGALFLAGGIAAAFMIPAPTWFVLLDLTLAYLPLAWLATRIGHYLQPGPLG